MRGIGMCEVNFCFEALCDELVAGKLASVVVGDTMDVSYEWCHHGHDGSCKSLSILSLWQFPHEQIVFASLCEGDDGSSAIFSDDSIYFPISESGSVGQWVSLIYHYSVLDSRVGNGVASFDMLEPMPATFVDFSSVVSKKVCKLTLILIFALSNKKQQEYGTYTRTNFGNYFELHK